MQRWTSVQPLDVRKALARRDSPFGMTGEDLADFRGIEIGVVLSKARFQGLDLSLARISSRGQLGGAVTFSQCLLRGLRCDRTVAGSFKACDFSDANLSGAVLLGDFTDCLFAGARMVGVRASRVTFAGCSFVKSLLDKSSFFDCRFKGCTLDESRWRSGSASGSRFEGCTFREVFFRNVVRTRTTGFLEETGPREAEV